MVVVCVCHCKYRLSTSSRLLSPWGPCYKRNPYLSGHMVYVLDGNTCNTLANNSLQLNGTGVSLPPFPSTASVLNINITQTAEEQVQSGEE